MNRIIFQIAIGLLAFWIFSSIIFYTTGLEFKDDHLEENFKLIRFWAVPICILLTMVHTIRKDYSTVEKILIITSTTAVTIVVFFIMVVSILGDMCQWTDRKVLFTSIANNNIKIIERDFGCGATDSGPPIVKNFMVKEYANYFKVAQHVDLEELDLDNWAKNSE